MASIELSRIGSELDEGYAQLLLAADRSAIVLIADELMGLSQEANLAVSRVMKPERSETSELARKIQHAARRIELLLHILPPSQDMEEQVRMTLGIEHMRQRATEIDESRPVAHAS
jgi:hypothetical protein